MTPLRKFVELTSGPVLAIHDDATRHLVSDLGEDVVVVRAGDPLPQRKGRWAGVVLAVADATALRRVAPCLSDVGRTKATACALVEGEQPALFVPRPEWPNPTQVQARRLSSGCLTTIRWHRPTSAKAVFEHLAHAAGTSRQAGRAGVVIAHGVGDPAADVPPDVVIGEAAAPPVAYAVTGRPPVFASEQELLAGPIDEGILNPHGFESYVDGPTVALTDLHLDPARGATAAAVTALRTSRGVLVDWHHPDPPALARAIAGLAQAGVPLLAEAPPPPEMGRWLGPRLRDALETGVDLGDPLRREEHSVRLRRAALAEHSMLARRRHLADRAGIPPLDFPTISVVLATKRKHQLEFALRQVTRQRGVTVELVLAAHGFDADPVQVAETAGDVPVTALAKPAETRFGSVLSAAVERANGDLVVKMDDDDWYGPDFLADLVLARHYSGADLVGTAPEFIHVEGTNQTVRRDDPSERYTGYVAGGTMLIDRLALRELGSFRPVHRFVDASLRRAVQAAGLSTYRTHGLGYVLRRTSTGHTWAVDDSTFLDPERLVEQWDGFAPSALLEYDVRDSPGTMAP